ncbi:hypothetical protein PIB30_075035 [Stylosanthes scabra]|uniref:Uncharacterized protein n=1 Tax=Stylosanthes scabra TaxID=79078 RepID=A0ABU6YR75_9FABA|nr:hypothetical protein [Stylosanthes scabra]
MEQASCRCKRCVNRSSGMKVMAAGSSGQTFSEGVRVRALIVCYTRFLNRILASLHYRRREASSIGSANDTGYYILPTLFRISSSKFQLLRSGYQASPLSHTQHGSALASLGKSPFAV